MPFHFVNLANLLATPWRNGGGVTRELACWPPGATTASFDWRLSLATVAADGDFSTFPGIDRVITLMDGAGMILRAHDGSFEHRLTTPFEPFNFSGDAGLRASLVDGACQDFNVMTRRGRWRSAVSRWGDATEIVPAVAGAIVCTNGSLRVDAKELTAGCALCWFEELRGWSLQPGAPNAAALLVRLTTEVEDGR